MGQKFLCFPKTRLKKNDFYSEKQQPQNFAEMEVSKKQKNLVKIGEGAYGKVYIVDEETIFKRNFVEDVLDFHVSVREMDGLFKLKHPYIAELKNVQFQKNFKNCSPMISEDYKDDRLHFVMERGSYDLRKVIDGNIWSFADRKYVIVHCMIALEFLHSRGVMHRDIKPSNIICFEENKISKLADLGMIKKHIPIDQNTPGVATSSFRAPEVCLYTGNYSLKSDVWSMGCTIYRIFSERSLFSFDDEDPEHIFNKLSEVFGKEELDKLSEKKYKLRGLKKDLDHYLEKINKEEFNKSPGSLSRLKKVLRLMLSVDPEKRISVTDALNMRFFDFARDLIEEKRKQFGIVDGKWENKPILKFVYKKCEERDYLFTVVSEFYNNFSNKEWYKDRVLFLAIDIYDRYLLQKDTDKYDKTLTELHFLSCFYLSYKYFNLMGASFSIKMLFLKKQRHLYDEYYTYLLNFEKNLIENVCKYEIYRDTLYTELEKKPNEKNIADILKLYQKMNSGSDLNLIAKIYSDNYIS